MTASGFLRLGVCFALIGVTLGIVMGASHDFALRPVHSHINLVGWVSMFLAGLFYSLRPAADGRLARAHLICALPGLVLLTSGIAGAAYSQPWGPGTAIAGSLLTLAGFGLFATNVMRHSKA